MPEIALPRQFDQIARVCDLVEAYAETHGWSASDVVRVGLVVGEAVGNAVEHGSGPKVYVRYGILEKHLHLRISDHGEGPSPEMLRGASLPDSPWATEGRGLYILSQLADEVALADGGLDLVLHRRE